MKKYIITTVSILSFSPIWAQQVADPSTNVPVEEVPQSHSFSYPLGQYNSAIKPSFVREWELEVPVQVGPDLDPNFANARVTTTYLDGFKRPIQEVKRRVSDNDEDVVKPYTYDALGRSAYNILTYIRPSYLSNGRFDIDPVSGLQATFNSAGNGSDQEPFSKVEYDNSPKNLIKRRFAPGQSWVGDNRSVNYEYGSNGVWSIQSGMNSILISGGYPKWKIGPNSNDIPQSEGNYAPNELSSTFVQDEDGNVAEKFADMFGNVVFTRKKIISGNNALPTDYIYTSYVYDDLGKLRCVIPPKANIPLGVGVVGGYQYTWSMDQTKMDNLCYAYFYDGKGRLLERKIPGKNKEYFVYDKWGRQILSQDGNLAGAGKWAFNLYDVLDRQILSGVLQDSRSRSDLQAVMDNDNIQAAAPSIFYYLKLPNFSGIYPTNIANGEILSTQYYDGYISDLANYTFESSAFPQTSDPSRPYIMPFVRSNRTDNLLTGTKAKILDPDNPGGNDWITTVNFYDRNSKLLQQQIKNHKGGIDITSYQSTFRGDLWGKHSIHRNPAAQLIPGAAPFFSPGYMTEIRLKNTYQRNLGANGNIWRYQQSINSGPAFNIADYEYTPNGDTRIKNLAGANVFYQYNIHNKLSSIGAYLNNQMSTEISFLEDIYYDKGFASKLYNGNIAGIKWRGYGASAPERFYGYSYDKIDRLTHAEFGERMGTPSYSKNVTDYTVSNITYDKNGNLLSMDQRGVGGVGMTPLDMDKLTYSYKDGTNELIKIEDAGDNNTTLPDFKNLSLLNEEYDYDDNGNLTLDLNKNISSITYNIINRPATITVTGKGTVKYVYDALGNKIQKKIVDNVVQTQSVIDYIGSFTYKNNILQHFTTDEGRCRPYFYPGQSSYGYTEPTSISYTYDYFIKDHLGNVRQTISTETKIRKYLAEHELASANIEQFVFDNIELVRDSKPGSTNPVDMMAAELIAEDPNKRVGTSILLKVMPGDQFQISADSYYESEGENTDFISTEDMFASLLTTLTGGVTFGGVPVADIPEHSRIITKTVGNPNLASLYEALETTNESPNAPKAYLNYLFFDENMNFVPDYSGRVQVNNGNGSWSTIAPSVPIKAVQPGYIAIFVGNHTIQRRVWFDKITISHTPGKVTDENHYYPMGLTLSTESAVEAEKNYIKYNSKELQKDEFTAANGNKSGLEMYDFGARMLDPQRGQWTSLDALSEKYYDLSPTAYVANNPVKYVDPDGKLVLNYTAAQLKDQGLTRSDVARFENIVNNIANIVRDNPQALDAIANTTGFSKDQILSDLAPNSGPSMKIDRIGGGATTSASGIKIDPTMIKNLASIDAGDKNELALQTLGMAMTVIHEYGHYGDIITNGGKTTGEYTTSKYPNSTGGQNTKRNYFSAKEEGVQKWKTSLTGERGADIEVVGYGISFMVDDNGKLILQTAEISETSKSEMEIPQPGSNFANDIFESLNGF